MIVNVFILWNLAGSCFILFIASAFIIEHLSEDTSDMDADCMSQIVNMIYELFVNMLNE